TEVARRCRSSPRSSSSPSPPAGRPPSCSAVGRQAPARRHRRRPSPDPPPTKGSSVKTRTKLLASAICGAAALVLAALPASAHATFPAAMNATGTVSAPSPAGAAQYVTLRVPEERPGPPKADNVDVKVELPAGWTSPVC